MAKSQIIVQLANGDIDANIALKRAKILLKSLENKEVMSWVDSELLGYENQDDIPKYRTVECTLKGTYLTYYLDGTVRKYTNTPLKLVNIPDEDKCYFRFTKINAGLPTIIEALNSKRSVGIPLPADMLGIIQTHMVVPGASELISAWLEIDLLAFKSIISFVENKLLDILLLLEEEFEVLDSLDIDTSKKEPKDINQIKNQVLILIYDDQSISIGDSNTFEDSTIASKLND